MFQGAERELGPGANFRLGPEHASYLILHRAKNWLRRILLDFTGSAEAKI
jgi:hypothetical protein